MEQPLVAEGMQRLLRCRAYDCGREFATWVALGMHVEAKHARVRELEVEVVWTPRS